LARVALRDRAAFRLLYDATAPRLLGVILRIQRHRETAEEVLQEVYLKVWDAAAGYQVTRAQPLTWLQAIARNAAIDSLRRQQAEPDQLLQQPFGEGGADPAGEEADDDPLARQASPNPGPAELLEQAWEARAVRGCMAQLDKAQRHCLALAFFDGLSHAEVASQLGHPLGTVKSWLRRSLQALQRCLAACGHTPGATGPRTGPM
jgi:RNA polymerase sigma-70 factor (ECF subfamily)